MTAARTRRGASRGEHDGQVCLCGVASRRRRHSESDASPPDEVLVRDRYEHAPYGRIWAGILVVNAQYCDDEVPVWCVSLWALPKSPVRIEGRGEARAVRISLWHLEEVGSRVIDQREGRILCMKGAYPPRPTPFRIVFCSRVMKVTTIRRLLTNTLRKVKRKVDKARTDAYLVARAVTFPAFKGRGSLVQRRTIGQFVDRDSGLRLERYQESRQ